MIHPHTEVKKVNDLIGLGVFATKFIPKGTITFAVDDIDAKFSQDEILKMNPACQAAIDKYAYVDEFGTSIVSWDHGKYVNHNCKPNTMSTGYGFEIAIRDIDQGEEITDEYGLFNLTEPMKVTCCKNNCRGYIYPNDIESYASQWDSQIIDALLHFEKVDQPLAYLLDKNTCKNLAAFLNRPTTNYVSVRNLAQTKSTLNQALRAC